MKLLLLSQSCECPMLMQHQRGTCETMTSVSGSLSWQSEPALVSSICVRNKTQIGIGPLQVRVFKDLIKQKEHMVLPDLAQDLAQVAFMPQPVPAVVALPCILKRFYS